MICLMLKCSVCFVRVAALSRRHVTCSAHLFLCCLSAAAKLLFYVFGILLYRPWGVSSGPVAVDLDAMGSKTPSKELQISSIFSSRKNEINRFQWFVSVVSMWDMKNYRCHSYDFTFLSFKWLNLLRWTFARVVFGVLIPFWCRYGRHQASRGQDVLSALSGDSPLRARWLHSSSAFVSGSN